MIYHLQCFQCSQCGKVLDSGDHYIVQGDDKLLCSNHYPNLQSLSNSTKNSSTELITDQEGEIVVKTEQSTLNSSIDHQSAVGHPSSNANPILHPHFTASLTASANVMDTMSNAIAHNHSSSPFLLNRQTPVSSTSLLLNNMSANLSTPGSLSTNSLIHSHHHTADLMPQSLSLIDYPSPHQPPSLIGNKAGLNEFVTDSTAEFYSTQSASCYVPPPNAQLNSLPAPNIHSMNSIYEQDALSFYNSAAGSMLAPTPNSPLNEIENTGTAISNGTLAGSARKGRPRKRKQIGLSSSNNTGKRLLLIVVFFDVKIKKFFILNYKIYKLTKKKLLFEKNQ